MLAKRIVPLVIILIGIMFVYGQAISFDFVNWDDDMYVLNNALVKTPSWNSIVLFFTEGNTANYHPLTMISLMVNYWLGGENPLGYHLVNVLFHLVNTILVFVWIRKVWPDKNPLLALMVAGIFGLHPMHVESVAWISERKDVLYVFFYLLGLIQITDHLQTNKMSFFWYALFFVLLAGLSKPAAVVFPLHFIGLAYLFSGNIISKQNILKSIPFAIISIFIGLATVFAQTDAGAVNVDAYSILERIQLASYALNIYLTKFFVPVHLSSFYPYPNRPFELLVTISPLVLFVLAFVVYRNWNKNRPIVFGLFFFIVSLILTLQLVTVGSTIVSERYTYLAYIGLSISVYFGLESLLKADHSQKPIYRIGWIMFVVVLTVVSFQRTKIWKNGETLWTDAIEKFPEVAGSWGGRGVYYRQVKKYPKALRDFNRAIELDPNEHMFYSNRGNIYFDLGKDAEAIKDYDQCLRLDSLDKEARSNRGAIYGRKGNFTQAFQDLDKAIEIDPDFFDAHKNKGVLKSQLGDRVGAKNSFSSCLSIEENRDEIWNAKAIEHQYLSEFDSSLICLNRAIQLNQNEAVYFLNRGISLRLLKRQNEANRDFDRAKSMGVQVDPRYYNPI